MAPLRRSAWIGLLVALLGASPLRAQESPPAPPARDLQKQLSNPVASLVSVPFGLNWDLGGDEPRVVLNIQPVLPFRLSTSWSWIVRLLTPIVRQLGADRSAPSSFGVGDLRLETYFAPPSVDGVTAGAGPALGVPVTAEPTLGTGKWLLGPTAVGLAEPGDWTLGALVTQLWSFAGDDDRESVNQTLLQPFVAYHAPRAITLALNSETVGSFTHDGGESWTVPVHLTARKVTRLGRAPISVQLGGGWFVEHPEGAPSWRLRSTLTLIFPR